MTSVNTQYAELVSLTQLFLMREYSPKQIKMVSPDEWRLFQKTFPSLTDGRNEKTKKILPESLPRIRTMPPEASTPPAPLSSKDNEMAPPSSNPKRSSLPPPAAAIPIPPIPTIDAKGISLEPLKEATPPFNERPLSELFATLFPHIPLCPAIPNDASAKRKQNSWQEKARVPAVLILSFQHEEDQLTLLRNLAKAISLHLAPAQVKPASQWIKEKGWEAMLSSTDLCLVIASGYDFYLESALKTFYREIPEHGKHFLGRIPLLLLSDLSLYLKTPALKAVLWRAICSELSSKNPSSHLE